MKSERRHELKENDLIHYVAQAKQYVGENGGRLFLGAVVVVAVIAVTTISLGSRAAAREEVWQRKNSLVFDTPETARESIKTLREITAGTTDRNFILSSLLEQGQYALTAAQQVEMAPDSELNEMARMAFNDILTKFPKSTLAVGSAHCGLATVEENAFSLDRDEAHKESGRRHLQAVLDDSAMQGFPPYRLAQDRLARLDDIFSVIRFAAAPAEAPTNDLPFAAPSTAIEAKKVPESEVPKSILQRVQVQPDGSLKVIGT